MYYTVFLLWSVLRPAPDQLLATTYTCIVHTYTHTPTHLHITCVVKMHAQSCIIQCLCTQTSSRPVTSYYLHMYSAHLHTYITCVIKMHAQSCIIQCFYFGVYSDQLLATTYTCIVHTYTHTPTHLHITCVIKMHAQSCIIQCFYFETSSRPVTSYYLHMYSAHLHTYTYTHITCVVKMHAQSCITSK